MNDNQRQDVDDALNPWSCRCGTLNGRNDTCYNCETGVSVADSVLSKDILDYYQPPIQPLTDDEVDLLASVSGVAPKKVRSIAWLVTMKLQEPDGPLLCENCGKTMAEHDALAHCWPAQRDGGDDAEEVDPWVQDELDRMD